MLSQVPGTRLYNVTVAPGANTAIMIRPILDKQLRLQGASTPQAGLIGLEIWLHSIMPALCLLCYIRWQQTQCHLTSPESGGALALVSYE